MNIHTERLLLRRYTHADIPAVLALVSQPSLAGVFSRRVPATAEGVSEYIDLQNAYQPFEQNKVFELAIERKADGGVIGFLGMVRQDPEQAEIGWALGEAYRGQGYATEAARALVDYGFHTLGLQRIYADTSPDNLASWSVMERLGMRCETPLRGEPHEPGESPDKVIYRVLADEWGRKPGDSPRRAGRTWKGIWANLGAPALIGLLLVLPFAALEWINRRPFNEGFPVMLFAILWLLAAIFILILAPLVRAVRAGKRIWADPIGLLLKVVCLVLIAWVWVAILVDQMPCFLGAPNCD
ncbi:MAG: GNAT family N-acetyltransferase [Anaerolineae bacterium]|nr:GNAT family N-acetyltransferase [Anaerolineae bacterium]